LREALPHELKMRLINTATLEIEEFFESNIPRYAILSHTWGEGEVTFKEFTKNHNLEAAGWTKIKKCCEFAQRRGQDYVWIDTCCIDKRSSAELSEAINSMYRWYRIAHECYAYLSDVEYNDEDGNVEEENEAGHLKKENEDELVGEENEVEDVGEEGEEDEDMDKGEEENEENDSASDNYWSDSDRADVIQIPADVERAFRASKWFTRGWTLQELLAPYTLYFIDRDWKGILGEKKKLSKVISEVTGIDRGALESLLEITHHSIAERMSWTSQRMCTRGEDVAYCLLGLFNVNMPLLYGEGKCAAFRRLQLEILKDSNDESIFAWYKRHSHRSLTSGILAVSPSEFENSANISSFLSDEWAPRQPYHTTNRGLAFQTVLGVSADSGARRPGRVEKDLDRLMVPLRCWDKSYLGDNGMTPLIIEVTLMGPQEFARIPDSGPLKLSTCPEELLDRKEKQFVGKEELIFIKM
jgi:hypothetical protein